MPTGVVRSVKSDRGFFFVTDDAGVSHFSHIRECPDLGRLDESLKGKRVRFDARPGDRGPVAFGVEVTE